MIKFGSLPSQTGLRAFTNYLIDIENVCILENHDGRDYDRKSMIISFSRNGNKNMNFKWNKRNRAIDIAVISDFDSAMQ
ncbi:uncharacterized protein NH340_JMT00519 [Sarcoptes scabiei]|nr:uncharacterized protein NH340_JMT00519 [Sarcoptes scabiei]